MIGKSTLEILSWLIISVGSVLGCLEEFQIHTDADPISVQTYPKNESEIISLTITCCQISSLYEYNYTFENLNVPQILIIANMKLSQFPVLPKWTGITDIQFKEFHYNQAIKAGAFKNLPKLKKIDFSRNRMTKIPLAHVGSSQKLILSHNDITDIAVSLEAEEIHLDHNPIRSIKVPFGNVKVVNLSSTAWDTMMRFNLIFKYPEELQKLDLAHCNISTISLSSFWKMLNLEDLYLDNNQITSIKISVFRDLKNLKILNLSHNKIENLELGLFDNLINLEILDLSHNGIKILDEEILTPLVNLRKFWLNENKINWWEVREIKMHNPNLTEINLMWNDWICADFAFIVKHLEIQNITLYKDDSMKLSEANVKGFPCVYQNISNTLCAN